MRILSFSLIALAVGSALLTAGGRAAASSNFKTLYAFCPQHTNCTDGSDPSGKLVEDAAGNFYGTTARGGANNEGTVFMLERRGTKYRHHVLYSFCAQANCPDGRGPWSDLVVDVNGNLYGTTTEGGTHFGGTAFELVAGRKDWQFVKLYDFCAQDGCADGNFSSDLTYEGIEQGALYDGTSPLYGANAFGGGNDAGTAYKLAPGESGWTLEVIHQFCSETNCTDGGTPLGPLLPDGDGNLLGTAGAQGAAGGGVLFQLSPKKKKGYGETVLYAFCQNAPGCADGAGPRGGLTRDAAGNIYGITQVDGNESGEGVVYKVKPKGTRSTETVLYSFCSQSNCADGAMPYAGVVLGPAGEIYGTTNIGGANNRGVVFKIDGATETVLKSFCDYCGDGAAPMGGVIMSQGGKLIGTTEIYGSNTEGGTVYELTP